MKRFVDLFLSVSLIVFLSPLLILITIVAYLKLGSPIFFIQKRPGLKGKVFNMIKFRTMSNKRDAKGKLLEDELRLNKFGNFLRQTSLDEIPELLNILKGEMSFIGPRPLLVEYLPLYSEEQKRRHDVKPGLTGWSQINGRNALSWEEKFKLDVWYVDNQSFLLDIKILFKTVLVVLKREGISNAECATMPLFTGSDNKEHH